MADTRKYPPGVRPSNRGGIEIRWKHRGIPYSEYIPETANQAGLKRATQIRRGRISEQKLATHYGLRAGETEAPAAPFSELAQEYLNSADLEASTRSNYKNALNKYWVPVLGSIPVSMITTKDIRMIMSKLNKITRKTQRNILIPMRRVMKYAVDMEYLISDPSAAISIRKGQKPLPDPFTLQEREAILDHLQGQAYFFYLFAFETGLRCPSEILALQWSDYDGKQLNITKARVIRQMKYTKTNEARKVFVTQRLKAELQKQKIKSTSEWMFVNSFGNPCVDADRFNIAWKKALAEAGVRYRRPYSCRHTYASLGLKAHAQPAFLASQLGHSLQMFYTTYAKWISEDDDIADLQRIEEYTEGG
jgi:integrase